VTTRHRIVVTGIGLVTSLGSTAAATVEAWRTGQVAARAPLSELAQRHGLFPQIDNVGEQFLPREVREIDPGVRNRLDMRNRIGRPLDVVNCG